MKTALYLESYIARKKNATFINQKKNLERDVTMKEFIKRKVDDLGRITLPIEFRRTLGIEVHDKVNLQFKDNGIFVYKQTEEDILKRKLEDVILAVSECKEIDAGEVATVVSILSKLVKECEQCKE